MYADIIIWKRIMVQLANVWVIPNKGPQLESHKSRILFCAAYWKNFESIMVSMKPTVVDAPKFTNSRSVRGEAAQTLYSERKPLNFGKHIEKAKTYGNSYRLKVSGGGGQQNEMMELLYGDVLVRLPMLLEFEDISQKKL